jgi:hypothetical protein
VEQRKNNEFSGCLTLGVAALAVNQTCLIKIGGHFFYPSNDFIIPFVGLRLFFMQMAAIVTQIGGCLIRS